MKKDPSKTGIANKGEERAGSQLSNIEKSNVSFLRKSVENKGLAFGPKSSITDLQNEKETIRSYQLASMNFKMNCHRNPSRMYERTIEQNLPIRKQKDLTNRYTLSMQKYDNWPLKL